MKRRHRLQQLVSSRSQRFQVNITQSSSRSPSPTPTLLFTRSSPPPPAHLPSPSPPTSSQRQSILRTVSTMMATLAIIIAGLSYIKSRDLLLNLNIQPITMKEFYTNQALIIHPIIEYARRLAQQNREAMGNYSTICIDGSWNHRRNGNFCIVEVIDFRTQKIVDFEIIYKTTPFKTGNYEGHSNGMELAATEKLLKRWINDPKVAVIVHDKDSKITKLIRESNWSVLQSYDANHAHKSFRRAWDGLPKEERDLLYGLKERLDNWLTHVLYLNQDIEKKKQIWLRAKEHFSGNHTMCSHKETDFIWKNANNTNALNVLEKLLKKGLDIIDSVNPLLGSTQLNEAFHQVKAKYADKRINYLTSTELRFAMAVISFNNSPNWQRDLRRILKLDELEPEIEITIERHNREKRRERTERKQEEYRKKENFMKKARRLRRKSQEQGKKAYKPLAGRAKLK
jgi:hypothetical protein